MPSRMLMDSTGLDAVEYVLVANIPHRFKAADLRSFFADLTEAGAFSSFHYRHRTYTPKRKTENDNKAAGAKESKQDPKQKPCCCPVVIYANHIETVLASNGKHWRNRQDEPQPERIVIERVGSSGGVGGGRGKGGPAKYKSKKELKHENETRNESSISLESFLMLPELRPPRGMPQGNVGTPIRTFLTSLSDCILPASVISRLGLVFPSSGQTYSQVKYQYPNSEPVWPEEGEIDSEDDAEEWERYESLHGDVTNQERNEERLFEEEVEVTWDKGSSGLVFHTDAAYWKEGELEEPDVDDWDVDTRRHYRHNAAGFDQDTKDMAEVAGVKLRASDYAPFERHTRSIGSKLLLRQGWKPGRGLGAEGRTGREEPVSAGSGVEEKRGLGYVAGIGNTAGVGPLSWTRVLRERSLREASRGETEKQPGISEKRVNDPPASEGENCGDVRDMQIFEIVETVQHPLPLTKRPTKYIPPPVSNDNGNNSESYFRGEKRIRDDSDEENTRTSDYLIKYRDANFVPGGMVIGGEEVRAFRKSDRPVLIGSMSLKDGSILPSSTSDVLCDTDLDAGGRAKNKTKDDGEVRPNTTYETPYFTSQGVTTM
eukprot:comp18320_c0_seq1/m.19389 comp18320_c0_seq1/g.19389  ORF comp18320_c0_seq1/g.19389 comp18320_c0_seq1/m.19389 type:complete len:600 (-) comp18320_c0_seq1:70-1869(-)